MALQSSALKHQYLLKKPQNITSIKAVIKKQFRERQKNSRYLAVNQTRDFGSNTIEDIQTKLNEIRTNLSKGFDSEHVDYLDVLFKEVEWELHNEELQRQAEQYELDQESQISSLMENLGVCITCNTVTSDVNDQRFICTNCSHSIFKS